MAWFRGNEMKKSPGDIAYERAMADASALEVEARSVRQQLEPYRNADNPFLAIQRSTSLDGEY